MKRLLNSKNSNFAIFLLALITILALLPLRTLKFDLDPQRLLPKNDEDKIFYEQFKEQFKAATEEESIFIALRNNNGIFQKDFLEKADSLSRFLEHTPHILRVYSPTNTHTIYFNGQDINARPLIHISQPEFYQQDSIYLFQSKEYRDLHISGDGRSIAIGVFHDTSLTGKQKDDLVQTINSKIQQLGFDETHIIGKVQVERKLLHVLKMKLWILPLILFAFITVILVVLKRSAGEILVCIAAILISIAWTLSIISMAGLPLDIFTPALTLLLFIVGTINFIFFSGNYRNELRAGADKIKALEIGLKRSSPAFFSCLAAAACFLIISQTGLVPYKIFAVIAAVIVLLSFFIPAILVFSFYTLTNPPKISNQKPGSAKFIAGNKFFIAFILLLLTAVSSFYILKHHFNTHLSDAIPKTMRGDLRFIEHHFSGSRPFEMVVTMKNNQHSFYDIDMMKKIEEIERFLKDSLQVGAIITPISLFKGANKAFHGGENAWFKIPDSAQQVSRFAEAIYQTEYADEMERYMLQDGSSIRISGRLADIGSREFRSAAGKFDKFFKDRHYDDDFSYKLTGPALLIDKVSGITKSLILVFLIAVGLYLLTMILSLQPQSNKNHFQD